MLTVLLLIAPLGCLALGSVILIRAKRQDPDWRPILPGIVGTVFGAWLIAASYFWFFELGTCSSRAHVACVLNQNQGALAVVALGLSVAAIWGSVLNRRADARAARRARLRHARTMLLAALEEVSHNLLHFAKVADERGVMHTTPNLAFRNLAALAAPTVQEMIHPAVLRSIETLLRIAANLESFLDTRDGEQAAGCYEAIIRHSLRILVLSGFCHPDYTRVYFEHPALREIQLMVDRMAQDGDVWTYCMSREATRDAPTLRSYGIPALCWIADIEVPGVTLIPLFQRFRDLPGVPAAW